MQDRTSGNLDCLLLTNLFIREELSLIVSSMTIKGHSFFQSIRFDHIEEFEEFGIFLVFVSVVVFTSAYLFTSLRIVSPKGAINERRTSSCANSANFFNSTVQLLRTVGK